MLNNSEILTYFHQELNFLKEATILIVIIVLCCLIYHWLSELSESRRSDTSERKPKRL